MTRITVTVLQDDIDNGQRNSASNCPIARAYKRETMHERVYVNRVSLADDDSGHDYSLPSEAQNFIWAFDNGLLMADGNPAQPFKFEIESKPQTDDKVRF